MAEMKKRKKSPELHIRLFEFHDYVVMMAGINERSISQEIRSMIKYAAKHRDKRSNEDLRDLKDVYEGRV